MSEDEHYLRRELYERVRTDPAIFDFLQQGSLDGLWYWDLDRPEHEWMSPRFWQVLGHDPATMSHDPASWQDIIDRGDLATALENFNRHCADATHPYDQIVRYRHREGHTVTIRCRGIAIRDGAGRAIRMLGAHTDISDLVEAEKAEREKEQAQAANLSKTIFLGNVSHEIRTPLNSILVIADALRNTDLSARQAHMLDDLLRAGDQLQGLLSDLIDISRIEAGEISMEVEALSPRAVMEDVAATFDNAAQEKGLALYIRTTVGAAPAVHGATGRIRQVLINLVSNAVKFTPSGSVTLACDTRAVEGSETVLLSFTVTDTGPGVPGTIRDVIFDRFNRDDTPRGPGIPGIGIGLSISKTICDRHGGKLTVADAPGGGAAFTATFATRIAPEEKDDGPATGTRGQAGATLPPGLRILVAEDVFLNRRALVHLLEPFGADLTFATNGPEALASLETTDFDVALVDLRMPGMSGAEVVERYRGIETGRGTARKPVIACSAHVLTDEKKGYLAAGFDAFLPKPFKRQEMIDIILSAMAR